MLERIVHSDREVLNFAETVREARGISRGKLESAIGVSQGMISRWQNSQTFCKRKELYKIFECLEIEFILRSDVCGEEGSEDEPIQEKQTKEDYLNESILNAIEEFLCSASESEKNLMLNYLTTAVLLTKR